MLTYVLAPHYLSTTVHKLIVGILLDNPPQVLSKIPYKWQDRSRQGRRLAIVNNVIEDDVLAKQSWS